MASGPNGHQAGERKEIGALPKVSWYSAWERRRKSRSARGPLHQRADFDVVVLVAVAAHLEAERRQADDVRPEAGILEQRGGHEEGRRDAVLAQPRGRATDVGRPVFGVNVNGERDRAGSSVAGMTALVLIQGVWVNARR